VHASAAVSAADAALDVTVAVSVWLYVAAVPAVNGPRTGVTLLTDRDNVDGTLPFTVVVVLVELTATNSAAERATEPCAIAAAVVPAGSDTATGTDELVVLPSPSSPYRFSPQA
jgi:hypothetical protein